MIDQHNSINDQLDRLLGDASVRLDAATRHLSPTEPLPHQRPNGSFDGRRRPNWLLPMTAVAALGTATAIVVVTRDKPTTDVSEAAVSPDFAAGVHGTEVVYTEVDDGDDNLETLRYTSSLGGFMTYRQLSLPDPNAAPSPTEVGPSTSAAVGAAPPATEAAAPVQGTAADSAAAQTDEGSFPAVPGECFGFVNMERCDSLDVLDEPQINGIGSRSATAQITVIGMPDDAYAVTLVNGTRRLWAKPIHGAAFFPFPESSSPGVTLAALGAGGQTLWSATANDDYLTTAEVLARSKRGAITRSLPSMWFADRNLFTGYGLEVGRPNGYATPGWFDGPFAIQNLVTEQPAGLETHVVTVLTSDLAEVTGRIGWQGASRTLSPAAGVSVVILAPPGTTKARFDEIAASLRSRAVEDGMDLSKPLAWQGADSWAAPRDPLRQLISTRLDDFDGAEVWASCDDIGTYQFSFVRGTESYGFVTMGPEPQTPKVGDVLQTGYLLPRGATTLSVEAGGRTYDFTIIHDATVNGDELAVIPPDLQDLLNITAVRIGRA